MLRVWDQGFPKSGGSLGATFLGLGWLGFPAENGAIELPGLGFGGVGFRVLGFGSPTHPNSRTESRP